MRICSYCGKYFAIPRRNTAEFCNLTADENGYTCREVSARKRWAEKKNTDELFKEYRREYRKRFNWIKAGKMAFDEFKKWLSES